MEKRPQTIMVNHSSYTKTEGDDPFAIGATTDGDGVLSYESSNESVAAVSEKGIVTLMGAGTANIAIRAAETENYEAAEKIITITVKPKSDENENPGTEKRPQTITVNHSSYTKTEGDDPFAIGATTDGDGVLSYESSNESVAVVSENGIVTLGGAGTADITIRAAETENYEAAEKLITITVNPKSGNMEGDFEYEERADDTVKITGYNGNGAEVVIPSEIDGKSVVMIGEEAFRGCSSLTSIEIPYGVTMIGGGAFRGCSSLTSIEIPDGVESIGDSAFEGCSSLTSIEIPDGVKRIDAYAFRGCSSLISIKIPDSVGLIQGNVFQDCGEGLCIYCDEGSYAETYATEYGFKKKTRKAPTITAADINIDVGVPLSLAVWTDSDGVLSYKSDDEEVVSVSDEGIAIGKKSGKSLIYIATSATDNYSAAEKTVTVTVNPKSGNAQESGTGDKPQKPPVKKAQSITAASFRKVYGDQPFALGARASGGGALSYAVKDSSVASVDGRGKVTLKGCGVTEITVRAASNSAYLAAEKTVTLTVEPKRLAVTSVKSAKARTLTVKWKRDKAASGYIIECSADRKFKKGVKRYTVKKNKTTSKKIKNLKAGRKYYVRAGGGKIKGAYGAAKKAVKVKR